MTTVIIAICDFFRILSCQHNYIIELYSISHIFHKTNKNVHAIHFNGF